MREKWTVSVTRIMRSAQYMSWSSSIDCLKKTFILLAVVTSGFLFGMWLVIAHSTIQVEYMNSAIYFTGNTSHWQPQPVISKMFEASLLEDAVKLNSSESSQMLRIIYNYTRPTSLLSQPGLYVSEDNINYGVRLKNKTFNILPFKSKAPLWDEFLPGYNDPGSEHFSECPFSNCRFISNSMIGVADAVLIHLRGRYYASPKVRPSAKQRTAKQVWIAVNLESPIRKRGVNFHRLNGVFNATAMYTRDSDIFFPYGYYHPRDSERRLDIATIDIHRPKLAAWFVSNCRSVTSGRSQFVATLKKFVPVDIYGKCGNLTCPTIPTKAVNQSCYEMLEKNYKFYLSFENSFCDDYVTEKVWNVLQLNVVPVVLGGANYSEFLPPKSYINVADFKSVEELANYLKLLNSNDTLYRQYFEWKQHYVAKLPQFKCDVCAYMNRVGNASKVVEDLGSFHDRRFKTCTAPNPKLHYWLANSSQTRQSRLKARRLKQKAWRSMLKVRQLKAKSSIVKAADLKVTSIDSKSQLIDTNLTAIDLKVTAMDSKRHSYRLERHSYRL